jgi:thiol-disulfide isomerase/thioredoxin
MTPESPESGASPPLRPLLWVSLCLIIASLAALASLWAWLELLDVEALIFEIDYRTGHAEELCASEGAPGRDTDLEETLAPPEDRLTSASYIGSNGVETKRWMTMPIDRVHHGRLQTLRLGSQRVLATDTIHIINLWAPYCAPCKAEMPDFKRLFAENEAQWADTVRFVPIQVTVDDDPRVSYEQFGDLMPARGPRLADRSAGFRLTELLGEGDATERLYHRALPVTFVLDCNRRVRWKKLAPLSARDFEELKQTVALLRDELRDTGPAGKCGRRWCGNGRCEFGERGECKADCDTRATLTSSAAPETAPPPPASAATSPTRAAEPRRCGKNMTWKHGRCEMTLMDMPAAVNEVTPTKTGPRQVCGDGQCYGGVETSDNCCLDCGCLPPLKCTKSLGRYTCIPSLEL